MFQLRSHYCCFSHFSRFIFAISAHGRFIPRNPRRGQPFLRRDAQNQPSSEGRVGDRGDKRLVLRHLCWDLRHRVIPFPHRSRWPIISLHLSSFSILKDLLGFTGMVLSWSSSMRNSVRSKITLLGCGGNVRYISFLASLSLHNQVTRTMMCRTSGDTKSAKRLRACWIWVFHYRTLPIFSISLKFFCQSFLKLAKTPKNWILVAGVYPASNNGRRIPYVFYLRFKWNLNHRFQINFFDILFLHLHDSLNYVDGLSELQQSRR